MGLIRGGFIMIWKGFLLIGCFLNSILIVCFLVLIGWYLIKYFLFFCGLVIMIIFFLLYGLIILIDICFFLVFFVNIVKFVYLSVWIFLGCNFGLVV